MCCAQFNTQLGQGAFKTVFKGFDYEEGIEIAWAQVEHGLCVRGSRVVHAPRSRQPGAGV